MKQRNESRRLILVFWIIAAAFLVFKCSQIQWAYFAGDGARELNVGRMIASGEYFPNQGVVVSFAQAHTGPAYYYLLAIPNLIWRDPRCAIFLVALYNILAAALLFRITTRFAGQGAGFAAAVFYMTTPFAGIEMNKIWGVYHMPVFVMGVIWAAEQAFFEKRQWRLLIGAACAGVLSQLNILGVIFVPFLIAGALVFRAKIRLIVWIAALAVFLMTWLPFIGYEAGNGFENTSKVLEFVRYAGHSAGAMEDEGSQGLASWPIILSFPYLLMGLRYLRPEWLYVLVPSLFLVGATLYGQWDALKHIYSSAKQKRFSSVHAKKAALYLAWFALPVLFLALYPGKVRTRYYLPGFQAGFLFAGVGLWMISSKLHEKFDFKAGAWTIAAPFIALLVFVNLAFTIGQNRVRHELGEVSIKWKLEMADDLVSKLGGGANLNSDFYLCEFSETEGRALGFDYIINEKRKKGDDSPPAPGIYLAVATEQPFSNKLLIKEYGPLLKLFRFESQQEMIEFASGDKVASQCGDLWNLSAQYHWQQNRVFPFDKMLNFGEPGPPQSLK